MRQRRFIVMLLLACVLLTGFLSACGSSETTSEEELKYTRIDNSYYVVSGIGKCTNKDIRIPAEYKGLPVKKIEARALKDCYELTSVVIPSGVTSIGDEAFQGCRSLIGLFIIPDGVTSIGERAFYGCSGLASFSIPDSVTSIGPSAFYGCTSLVYNIHDTENYLGNETNPYAVLIKETESSIEYCVLQPSTRIIYDSAFRDCHGLEIVVINNALKAIGDYVFQNCTNLRVVAIPNSVESIGDYVFQNCTSLRDIVIPDSVLIVGDYAFSFCDKLTDVTIGSGVASIGEGTFYRSILSSIKVAPKNSVYHESGNCLIETASKTLIFGCVTSVIPTDGSVTSIGEQAFSCCARSLSLTIPDGVTSIGGEAFADCKRLTSITLPNSVTSIGKDAFARCNNLTDITFTGTQAQWDAIAKGDGWNTDCPAEVTCTG